MKTLQLLLCLLVVQIAFGQRTTHAPGGNPYLKYAYSSFECRFRSTDKTISACCDTAGENSCSNFLSSGFSSDSTYRVVLTLSEIMDSKLRKREYIFEGKYTIDQNGNIVLKGKHPFSTDIISIQEKKHKNSTYTLRYKFKLNNDFNRANDRKLFAYCDGSCEVPRAE